MRPYSVVPYAVPTSIPPFVFLGSTSQYVSLNAAIQSCRLTITARHARRKERVLQEVGALCTPITEVHFCGPRSKMDSPLLSTRRFVQTEFPSNRPEEHLVADAFDKPHVRLVPDGLSSEEVDDVTGEERVARLFAVSGDDPIVPAEVASR